MIRLKNREELKRMRAAGKVVSEVLMRLEEEAKEGVTTWELNEIAERMCATGGFKPAFKGYANYPASVCFALNEEIVHGIPSKKKVLKDGDIVGIDFGVLLDGYYADSAITVAVGKIRPVAEKLLRVTRDSLYRGIDMVKSSNRVLDISKEIQTYVENEGFSIVRDFVGHGIGRELHEEPQVPNFIPPNGKGGGIRLRSGMVMAIEPMVNEGSEKTKILEDGWTAVTYDGKLSAHFEHTVALTDNGPEILTERIH
ncbi:MAG: type I methionyl aminopeptidase [Candidatus Dadabacteria bacterium]|nr:type I methionyl aminopeptidase [Candidatus Dadabacteria bacterium]MXZ47877.1 type I methionyl aminopeptidase [Candidatus Dadabacteria bacterium]MYB26325.1 type I methionyl aminopeptidase [Candidatus Dadabacteria bacterium]MYE61469.1 type I methionyl aminopeptidase [Candidatus Dadabacteria bacterium]MYI73342.1 type I methionyl aminopeptidase [Candidatus Dadabacteria bacterium]